MKARRASAAGLAVIALAAACVLAYNVFVVREPEWIQDVMLAVAILLSFALGAASSGRRGEAPARGTGWRPGPSYVRAKMTRKAAPHRPAGKGVHE